MPVIVLLALSAAGAHVTRAAATPPAFARAAVDSASIDDGASIDSGPVVSSVNPPAGPLAGGTVVTIDGSGFTGASAVSFGAVAAPSFTVISDIEITATAPAGAGTVNVTVSTPGATSPAGSSAQEYTYLSLPAVTGVAPATGPSTGGTIVTVTGTGFTGASAVDFGAVRAPSVTVLTDARLTAVAPAGATGPVDVTVTGPDGTSAVDGADRFTYASPPTGATVTMNAVSGVTPASVTLHATVLTGGSPITRCRFQYGDTAHYGRAVACVQSGGGSASSVAVSAVLSGLTPATRYHDRLSVTTAAGTRYGPDETFSTAQLPAVVAPLVGLVLQPVSGRPGVIGELLGVQGISGAVPGVSIVLRCVAGCARRTVLSIPLRGASATRREFTLAHPLALSAATRVEIDIAASGKLSRFARYAFAPAGASLAVHVVASGCLSAPTRVVRCPG